jgi:hypothetical protein
MTRLSAETTPLATGPEAQDSGTSPVRENRTAAQATDRPVRLGDLVALNRRLVELFTTLNEGLTQSATDKAAADRAALSARLDGMERTVDGLEGLLRIELDGRLRAVCEEIADRKAYARTGKRVSVLALVLALLVGLCAGVLIAPDLARERSQAQDLVGISYP